MFNRYLLFSLLIFSQFSLIFCLRILLGFSQYLSPSKLSVVKLNCEIYCINVTFLGVRSALFWDITQRRVVMIYRRFGTTYLSHLEGSRSPKKTWTSWPLKIEPIRWPETSVSNYHTTWSLKMKHVRFPETSVKIYHATSQKSAHLINIVAEAWNQDL